MVNQNFCGKSGCVVIINCKRNAFSKFCIFLYPIVFGFWVVISLNALMTMPILKFVEGVTCFSHSLCLIHSSLAYKLAFLTFFYFHGYIFCVASCFILNNCFKFSHQANNCSHSCVVQTTIWYIHTACHWFPIPLFKLLSKWINFPIKFS